MVGRRDLKIFRLGLYLSPAQLPLFDRVKIIAFSILLTNPINTNSENKSENSSIQESGDTDGNNMPKYNENVSGFWIVLKDVFIAGIFATGIWVLGDAFHDKGYESAADIADFSSCIIFLSVLPFELSKHKPKFAWIIFLLFLAFVVAPVYFVFFYLQAQPEPKPYPHFEFRFLKQGGNVDEALELTNDCLVTKFGPVSIGYLFCATNFVLISDLQNLGPEMSENTRITIIIPKSFSCDAPGYEYKDAGNFIMLTVRPPDLLSGDGWLLPEIRFRTPPVLDIDQQKNLFTILTRAKDSPAEIVAFIMTFAPLSTQQLPTPIIRPVFRTNDTYSVSIPQEITKLLIK